MTLGAGPQRAETQCWPELTRALVIAEKICYNVSQREPEKGDRLLDGEMKRDCVEKEFHEAVLELFKRLCGYVHP